MTLESSSRNTVTTQVYLFILGQGREFLSCQIPPRQYNLRPFDSIRIL